VCVCARWCYRGVGRVTWRQRTMNWGWLSVMSRWKNLQCIARIIVAVVDLIQLLNGWTVIKLPRITLHAVAVRLAAEFTKIRKPLTDTQPVRIARIACCLVSYWLISYETVLSPTVAPLHCRHLFAYLSHISRRTNIRMLFTLYRNVPFTLYCCLL